MNIIKNTLFAIAAIFAANAAHSAEVNLESAILKIAPPTPGGYCPSCYSFTGEISLENIAYSKNVVVAYSVNGGEWKDISASYSQSIDNNREIWTFRMGTGYVGGPANIEFAIGYDANGQSYWDNNNSQNYFVSADTENAGVVLTSNNLVVDNQRIVYNSLVGDVYLNNLAYDKEVVVVYTTDNWATANEAYGVYVSGSTNASVERWGFSAELPEGTESADLAVGYTVGGVTYWDNNFGQNHTALPNLF